MGNQWQNDCPHPWHFWGKVSQGIFWVLGSAVKCLAFEQWLLSYYGDIFQIDRLYVLYLKLMCRCRKWTMWSSKCGGTHSSWTLLRPRKGFPKWSTTMRNLGNLGQGRWSHKCRYVSISLYENVTHQSQGEDETEILKIFSLFGTVVFLPYYDWQCRDSFRVMM